MNMKTVIIVAGIVVLVIGLIVTQTNKENTQMNNRVCPVSGKPVNEEHTYIHKGKEYNLCSDKCKQHLSENPEKYLSE